MGCEDRPSKLGGGMVMKNAREGFDSQVILCNSDVGLWPIIELVVVSFICCIFSHCWGKKWFSSWLLKMGLQVEKPTQLELKRKSTQLHIGAIRVARDDSSFPTKWGAKEPQNPQNHRIDYQKRFKTQQFVAIPRHPSPRFSGRDGPTKIDDDAIGTNLIKMRSEKNPWLCKL